MNGSATRQGLEVQVEALGTMPRHSAEQARASILALVRRVPVPVRHARVKLTHLEHPEVARPHLAQANLDVGGRLIRAQVAAESMPQAVDLLQDRLAGRLTRISQTGRARLDLTPSGGPHEGLPDSEPAPRPEHCPRPVDERRLIRRKSVRLSREAPDQAAFQMEAMDYDFHLFTDAVSGQDSVIHRAGPTGYRLARLHPGPDRPGTAVPLTVSRLPAPRMSLAAAVKRLDVTGFPFLFFADAATGRGNILYHRYDGHYGLIMPAE